MCLGIKSNKVVPVIFEKKEGYDTEDCSICLEKLIDDDIEIELPCKHRFHIYCIQKWVGINKNCPLCRKTF